MGKNLYETPRDMNKWHTQKDSHEKTHTSTVDNKKRISKNCESAFRRTRNDRKIPLGNADAMHFPAGFCV